MRVLELGGIGPTPFCAMMLADMGADVIKVHRVSDGPAAVPNAVLDRGRRSVAVDIKTAQGREIVRSLLAHCDAVIEGFRPGVAERLGFDPDQLRKDYPRLVIGRMTGYGQHGPLSQAAGHDINYIALSGVLAAVGRHDTQPTPPLNLVGDFGGGGMLLAFGVVAAVLHARTHGEGLIVDASMVDGSALLMAMIHGYAAQARWTTERGANMYDSGAPYYDTYRCADGRFIAVGAIEPQFFSALIDVLGVSDHVPDGDHRDRANWPALRAVLGDRFAAESQSEWLARFEGIDACVSPVLDYVEAQSHPHNIARGTFFTDAAGVPQPAPAPRFPELSPMTPEPAARPGEHTREILAEIGYRSTVDALIDARVVAEPSPRTESVASTQKEKSS